MGGYDRVVPIGERALLWVAKYKDEGRAELAVDPTEQGLFLTRWGARLTPNAVTKLVTVHIRAAALGKTASAHSLRHSMATSMLENGCDVRYIQAILGHKGLKTTQIYTHVSITNLKEVHSATHPTASLKPKLKAEPSEAASKATEADKVAVEALALDE
jgi:integrase/recombinase XerD